MDEWIKKKKYIYIYIYTYIHTNIENVCKHMRMEYYSVLGYSP